MATGLLPAWFPTEPLLVATIGLIVLILVWNRGNWWIVNVLAADEPVLAAIGLFVMLGAGWFTDTLGLAMIPVEVFWLAGAVAVAVAVLARYTDRIDVSGLI